MMVLGESEDCCWGVWVEVDEAAYARVHELWGDAAQATEPPFHGVLANNLEGYEDTIGLAGSVQLTGPTSVPVSASTVQHAATDATVCTRNASWSGWRICCRD